MLAKLKSMCQITHAGGYISGLLSAKPYITLCDHTYVNTITPGGNGQVYKAIVQYSDEVRANFINWLGD